MTINVSSISASDLPDFLKWVEYRERNLCAIPEEYRFRRIKSVVGTVTRNKSGGIRYELELIY